MILSDVRSWGYVLPGTGSNGFEAVAALPVDMLILSGFETKEFVTQLQAGGPNGSRLVFGYVDVAEFGTYLPEWRASYDANQDGRPDAGAPDWLANANGAFAGLYTANYWTQSWREIVFRLIDDQIAKGYDGIFLDAVLQYMAHTTDNRYGNPVRATAAEDMVQLVKDIYDYIHVTKGLANFTIIANSPHELYAAYPQLVNYMDAVVVEGSYWNANAANGLAFASEPTTYFDAVMQVARPFAATGKPVFAVDYVPQAAYGPQYAATADAYNFDYFQKMIANGMVGTLTHPFQRSIEVPNFPNYVFGHDAGELIQGLTDGRTDYLYGGAGADTLNGQAGANYMWGGDGPDQINGGPGFDYGHGNQGADTIHGAGGDDWVVGGKDDDQLYGDDGDDIVLGNVGADTLEGGEGRDQVRGGQGDDRILGGGGSDYLSGDRGDDTIQGGAGADFFHTFAQAGIDRVLDFSAAEGDRVMLDPGTAYALSQVGADVVIDMGSGAQMVLVGVQLSSLPFGWIFEAAVVPWS